MIEETNNPFAIRRGSKAHKVLAMLAQFGTSNVGDVKREIESTETVASLRTGVLMDLIRAGYVQSMATDFVGITNAGLDVKLSLGAVPLRPRKKHDVQSELFKRPDYDPSKDVGAKVVRQGAYDAFEMPSRMGDKLYYRGGRVESVQ